MSMKYTRGIDNSNFLNKLDKSNILQTVKADPDLFLGIRNNYANIYYEGASLSKIEYVNNNFCFSIAKKYLDPNDISGYNNSYSEICLIRAINNTLKIDIHKHQMKYKNYEKIAQQKLMLNNNKNPSSNWFCVDMEYNMQRKNKNQPNFGRFDIVAITKEKPHRIALIELKYGCNAYGGNYDQLKIATKNTKYKSNKKYILSTNYKFGSGILGHVCDYIRYIKSGNISTLKNEIIQICNNYSDLGMLSQNPNLRNMSIEDFSIIPEVYFITIGEDIMKAKTQMRKYLLSKSTCRDSSIYNVEDVLNVDIKKDIMLSDFNYLFCDEDISNLNIDDIIDYKKYSRGI